MSLWTFLFGSNDSSSTDLSNTTNTPTINPANGLPMINGIGSVDVAGNVYGTDATSTSSISDLNTGIIDNSSFGLDSSSIWDSSNSFDTGSSFDSSSIFNSSSSLD